MKYLFLIILIISTKSLYAQNISGKVETSIPNVQEINVRLLNTNFKTQTDSLGFYNLENVPNGTYKIQVTSTGFKPIIQKISLLENENLNLDFELEEDQNELNEVVVSGTLKPVKRLESAVPVEVYSPVFFKKNPTPSIYDALQNINGVRPQLNCGVCNTGDIHINGLEGPYTLVMIDGMPIVSSLSTVYGLSGIPNSLVERIEIVKGPASSLYGSEAVGGLINIIT